MRDKRALSSINRTSNQYNFGENYLLLSLTFMHIMAYSYCLYIQFSGPCEKRNNLFTKVSFSSKDASIHYFGPFMD